MAVLLAAGSVQAQTIKREVLPDTVLPVLDYMLNLVDDPLANSFDAGHLDPLVAFMLADKPKGTAYKANGAHDAPSAYHQFWVNSDLLPMVDYSLDENIPSFFLWPSSVRLSHWTRVDGGAEQLAHLKQAARNPKAPFLLRGVEHMAITPDQHTGAYYSYDLDKAMVLTPYGEKGVALVTIYRQQGPSEVGKKGWVLGTDDDWNYLYTDDTGLNVGGLGWAKTYMYDSFGVTVYLQPDRSIPKVMCATVSWVKAGWAGINMVQPKHIHRGLIRVAKAFKDILEDPRLPAASDLAQVFLRSKSLPTTTLQTWAKDYYKGLEARMEKSPTDCSQRCRDVDTEQMLADMDREELYATMALDYFKKLLGREPVMASHPF